MKRSSKVFAGALLAVFSLGIVACDKQRLDRLQKGETKKPENEVLNKKHDDPFVADFILVEGTLPVAQWGEGDLDNTKYNLPITAPKYKEGTQQVLRYKLDKEKGWHIVDGAGYVKKFAVKASEETENTATVYSFKIRYYSYNGEEMTYQFVQEGQDKIHQHFFQAERFNKNNEAKRVTKFFDTPWDYRYCDTEDINDDNSKFVGNVNPTGLKGLLRFNKRTQTDLNMIVRLVHHGQSKYQEDGSTSKFYKPTRRQILTEQPDIEVHLPIQIQ